MTDSASDTDAGPPAAKAGEALDSEALQASVDDLRSMAASLDSLLTTTTDVDAVQEIGRLQQALRHQAGLMVDRQVDLLAGSAKVTAEQINAATNYARAAIAQTKDWASMLRKGLSLVSFLGVVLTGNGGAIVQSAVKLKSDLDKA